MDSQKLHMNIEETSKIPATTAATPAEIVVNVVQQTTMGQ